MLNINRININAFDAITVKILCKRFQLIPGNDANRIEHDIPHYVGN